MNNKKIGRKIAVSILSAICAIGMFGLNTLTAFAAPTINVGSSQSAGGTTVSSVNVSFTESATRTDKKPLSSYAASIPGVVTLADYNGNINVVSYYGGKIYVNRYDTKGAFIDSISITQQLPVFGNITCDDKGNYYVVSGKSCGENEDVVVMNISKYDYAGFYKGKCELKSLDTGLYSYQRDNFYWGTQNPFRSGNCQIAYNNGYVCVNYARQMFSGHQSNNVIYVECSTMTRKRNQRTQDPYMSHSFDQRVIGTSDGTFLLAGQGDAYDRGFGIWKIEDLSNFNYTSAYPFHFREGAARDHGYNETFAQLGGMAETSKSYVLCGSSEKTLSSDTAPSSLYMGHNEARNLFVQYIKKDFTNSMSESDYYVQGETRYLIGSGNAEEKRLDGNETDYGVIWLTDLDNNHYVGNPKIVSIEDDKILIMWEERSYTTSTYSKETIAVYYAILDAAGNVVMQTKRINGVQLAANQDPIYESGTVYWATNDDYGCRLNMLKVKEVDRTVVEAFVKRLYTECLGRPAEETGLKGWTDQLCQEKIDGATVGAGFVFSDEYMNKGTTKVEYLTMLYSVFMGREPDDGGIEYWLDNMKNGMTREDVFKGFVESKEYTQICEDYGITRGNYYVRGIADPPIKNGIVTPEITGFVERIYVKALGRKSDPEGINYWSREIANEAKDPIAVAEYFIISPEFEAKKLDDTEYVKVLYRTFMGREYDDDGLKYWLGRMQNGDTRQKILEDFASCPEFQDIIKSFGL